MINAAVASLVGRLCSRKQEVGRVIDSQLVGVVACCVGGGEGKLEGASGVLRLDGASDSEGGAPEHLLLGVRGPIHRGGNRDLGQNQQVCQHKDVMTGHVFHPVQQNTSLNRFGHNLSH